VAIDRDLEPALLDTRLGLVVSVVGWPVGSGANPIIALVFCFHDRGPLVAMHTMIRTLDGLTRVLHATTIVAFALAFTACSSTPKDDPNSTAAVEKLYADAKDDLNSGSYDKAIKTLERVEGRAAGTLLAQQATLDLAYAQYRTAERAAALATLDRFIKLNPSSPALDYALYLRGLVNFNDNLGILGSLAQQQLSERDQQASRDAYQSFKQLVTQFPQSRYADDARARMDYIVNALAEYELHVARYYFRRGAFLAAANRAQQAVVEYPQTPANEEALYIMMTSYERLGLDQLRSDTERVLKQNFPAGRFSADGMRQAKRAWWQFW
jgi:outer membrane protein assembly factor BamD